MDAKEHSEWRAAREMLTAGRENDTEIEDDTPVARAAPPPPVKKSIIEVTGGESRSGGKRKLWLHLEGSVYLNVDFEEDVRTNHRLPPVPFHRLPTQNCDTLKRIPDPFLG